MQTANEYPLDFPTTQIWHTKISPKLNQLDEPRTLPRQNADQNEDRFVLYPVYHKNHRETEANRRNTRNVVTAKETAPPRQGVVPSMKAEESTSRDIDLRSQRFCPVARKSDSKTTGRTIKVLLLLHPLFTSARECTSRDFLTRESTDPRPPVCVCVRVSEGNPNFPMIITCSGTARALAVRSQRLITYAVTIVHLDTVGNDRATLRFPPCPRAGYSG